MEQNLERITKHVIDIHTALDKTLKSFSNCCTKGCAYCCIQPIEIVNIEELPIKEFIKNSMSKEYYTKVRLNVLNWAEYFNANYNDTGTFEDVNREFRELINKDKIACPFLIENNCSIYPVRPLACRSYLMVDSPELCRLDGLREAPNIIVNLRIWTLKNLTSVTNTHLRYLPVALSEQFDLARIFKPHRMVRFN